MAYKQIQKILNPATLPNNEFGNITIVDGYHMGIGRTTSQSSYIFKRDVNGVWQNIGTIDGKDSLAMYGSYVVSVRSNLNTLYIYDKDDNSAALQSVVEAGATATFGNSVAISEDYIVVGDQAADTNRGEVYIYEKTGTDTWTAYANNPIAASARSEGDFFGSSVATNNESIIIGASGDSQSKGAVYVFQKNIETNIWEQTQKLFASDGDTGDSFGESVSASGDSFVIGASFKDSLDGGVNSGAAYIFKYSTEWYEIDKLVGVDEGSYEGNHFGESVYINGDHIVVGSPDARDYGVADVFYKKRSWGHLKKIVGGDSATSDGFGTSVSISGRFIASGSPLHSDAVDGGAVYVYEDPSVVLRLAQEFEVGQRFLPSKATVYLKRVGENTSDYWAIYNNRKTVIDATNFSTIDEGNSIITFDDTISGFTGNGYMIMNLDNPSFLDLDMSVINYPVRAITADTFNLWIRCINANNSNFEVEILIDGNVSKTIVESIDNPSDGLEWSWVNTFIVLPDVRDHTLGIRIKENGLAIDKIYIDANSFVPYTEGPDYSVSPYLTTHMKVYDSVSDEPGTPLYIYDHKNSLTEIVQDDWYNFNIKVLDNNHGYMEANDFVEDYYLVMSTSGSNTSNFIIWELVDNDEYNAPASAIKF